MKIFRQIKILAILVLAVCPIFSFGQTRQIKGVVTSSEDKNAIPGCAVLVPGTSTGTSTDIEGLWVLDVPLTADSLEFRFIGMVTQKSAIPESGLLNIILLPESFTVGEVVVTALGISRESKSLGYSMTAIKGDDLTRGGDRSMLNAMQGKVAGVNISSASGAPGASTRVLVRGVSSLTGSNQPLYVIDGVPVSNSQSGSSSINGGTDFGNKMNDLNSNEIESISILKGASGTALYGSSASSGVIIITTKKGQKNKKSQVDFNTSIAYEQPLKLVQYQNEFGQGINGNAVLYENTSWGPRFDYRFRPWGHEVDNSLRVKAYRPLPDNVKEFFETGKSYNNSLAISGGNEASSYYFSYSNIYWDGIFPTDADKYTKHTFSLRSTYEVSKHFKTSASFNYIKKNNSSVPTGQGEQSVYNMVMQTPRDISLREQSNLQDKWNTLDNHYSLYTVNPYHILNNNGNINNDDRIFGSLDLDYSLLKYFSIKWRIGGDISNAHIKSWQGRVKPEGNNEFASVYNPGFDGKSASNQMLVNSDLIASFDKKKGNWSINALAGNTLTQRSSEGVGSVSQNRFLEEFNNLSNTTEAPSAFESSSLRRMVAVFGSADLAYKNFAFVSVTGRNEWSSTLPPKNNSYFFPGANAGLILTELLPIQTDILPYAKIRVSWAKVGNDAPAYLINSVFQKGSHSDGFGGLGYPLNNVTSYDVGDLIGNSNLAPELTREFEVGTDLRFVNNRISMDLVYYNKASTNLIWLSPVPFSTGFSNRMQNLGRISNYGIESLIHIVPVRRSNFEWEFTLNFTRNFNNLDYLSTNLERAELNALRIDGGQQISWSAIPGHSVGVFECRTPKYTSDGKMIVDNRGIPVADDDMKIFGNSEYKYFGGITNQFTYRGFSLSANFDFRYGGLMYSRTKDITQWAGTVPSTLYNNRQPFIIPNSVVELKTDAGGTPVYIENNKPIDPANLLEFWGNGGLEIDRASLIDKSFMKLREVILSYSLKSKYLEKVHIKNMSVSIVGKNLLLWTPKGQTYIDPELTTFGNDLGANFGEYGAQPSTRSFSINLRLSF